MASRICILKLAASTLAAWERSQAKQNSTVVYKRMM